MKALEFIGSIAKKIGTFAAVFLAVGAALQAFDNEFSKHTKSQSNEASTN